MWLRKSYWGVTSDSWRRWEGDKSLHKVKAVNWLFLVGFLVIPAWTYWRMRSVSWLVIATAGSVGIFGAVISFAHDRGHLFTQVQLQWSLLVSLLAILVVSFIWPTKPVTRGFKRQFLTVWLPLLVLAFLLFYITTFMTQEIAFLRPVGYLIGHGAAEDNAKWLDFTAQWAAGGPIDQGVPLGGPLQLVLTFVGTLMSAASSVLLGGVNQVAVAANTVVFGQFFLAISAPLVLAPLAEQRFKGRAIPAPFIWLGGLVTTIAALVVINNGHLTLQFAFLAIGLWSTVYLSDIAIPRAKLIASLATAAAITVWLPLNGLAVVILLGWLFVFGRDALRNGLGQLDWIGVGLWSIVTVGIFQPVVSSMNFVFGTDILVSAGVSGGGVAASAHTSQLSVFTGLADTGLFAASGGTESVGPLLGILAVASAIAAGMFLRGVSKKAEKDLYVRFAPIGAVTFFAFAIYVLDFWVTGDGPNYGSQKFTFLVVIVATTTTLPLALMLLDPDARSRMSALRWIGVAGVVVLLTLDSILPRAVAIARPENWSPPIPFNNSSGGYWWPAEVNGSGNQLISSNPVACVYLPNGATAPSAVVPSGLSDAQRVYSCTRQLAGLSGVDSSAQPIVDWLRKEWFSNKSGWDQEYVGLSQLPDFVLDRPVILLDEGSNVIGLESMRTLLERYKPASVG